MKEFFLARSVAVVGVSSSPLNLGRAIAFNLTEFEYDGCFYLVGPRGGAFLGHRIYPSVTDIPEPVDLAVLLVPAPAVPDVLRQCGEKGIHRVIVESAGFRELGEDRIALEDEVRRVLDEYGMRMIGPNCLGIINRYNGLALPFMPIKAETSRGKISIISQSGGVGAMMLNTLASENLGLSKFASIGNRLDVDETELLQYFVEDGETEIIFCYLEGIARGRSLMELALQSRKPIIVHKSNSGRTGAAIARSHSASLSADDQVVGAAFRQCGVIRTREQREAIGYIKSFSLPPTRGNRLAIISRSGGHAVMAADAAEEYGFVLPPFPPEILQLVREHSRAGVIQFQNPMDLGDLFDLPLYRTLAEKTLARDDIDGLVFIHNYQGVFDAEESRQLVESFGDLIRKYRKPMAVCVFTTRQELSGNLRRLTFPVFSDPREAVKALARNRDQSARRLFPFSTQRPDQIDAALGRSLVQALEDGPIDPERLAAILACYGIPMVKWERAESPEGAVEAALSMGFPVVLKTANPDVIHKTEVGGVYLNLPDEESVRKAYEDMESHGEAVLVQKMTAGGLEWLVGGRQDRDFGGVLVAGLGGVHVEVFKETSIRIVPLVHEEAQKLIDECRGAALLAGIRGEQPRDRGALADLLVRVSWVLHDLPQLQELDLNPVAVFREGCMALDWRATWGSPPNALRSFGSG